MTQKNEGALTKTDDDSISSLNGSIGFRMKAFCAVVTLCLTFIGEGHSQQGSTQPSSILVYVSRAGQSEEFAKAAIFSRRDTFSTVSHFYPPNDSVNRILVENSYIVAAVPIDDVVCRDTITRDDVGPIQKRIKELLELGARSPQARVLLRPFIERLKSFDQQLGEGSVLYRGVWMKQTDFDGMIRLQEKQERERLMALEAAAKTRREARELELRKLLESKRAKVREFVSEVSDLAEEVAACFNSDLASWMAIQQGRLERARRLMDQYRNLPADQIKSSVEVDDSLLALRVMAASEEARVLWEKGGGKSALEILEKFSVPEGQRAAGTKNFWIGFQSVRREMKRRCEEYDKEIALAQGALDKHKTSQAIQHLETAYLLLPNDSLKQQITKLKENSLGL